MDVGIGDAKSNLSKLIDAVLEGEEVFLANRGAGVVQLVIAPQPHMPTGGRGA